MKKVLTITCHDVYNVGASLQAFALLYYLTSKGFDAEIIDYKPEYLSGHYSLSKVSNPRYDYFPVKYIYLAAKLPERMVALNSKKKKVFDQFTKNYLKLTEKRYTSNNDLKTDVPEADIYIAGSDQIWNPVFKNGKDPAFFLDFVPENKVKLSYAASFAVDSLANDIEKQDYKYLKNFNAISVREKNAVNIIEHMGLNSVQVCDPVFLLPADFWKSMCGKRIIHDDYIFYYDFDGNSEAANKVRTYANDHGLKIYSAFKTKGMIPVEVLGPLEFLNYIYYSSLVVSNSFHATAFSIILHKDFYTFGRKENINSRMRDLMADASLKDRLLKNIKQTEEIDWQKVDERINKEILFSKRFLEDNI